MEKRVFISATSNKTLDDRRRSLKGAIIEKIRTAGFAPQEFWESGTAENMTWSFENVDSVMRSCVGAVIFGFPRWIVREPSAETRLIGEFNHYEGAVAITHDLPILILAEQGVESRGVVWTGGGKTITFVPSDADAAWLSSQEFTKRFEAWKRDVDSRKDVFLGYCSKAKGLAAQIQLRLTDAGASVLNWEMDFRAGGSILDEIDRARSRCSSAVFLFTEDDPLEGKSGGAAPRDNVVFEAGYFMSAKGSDRVLIIREGDAKMPADIGGAIYLHIEKDADVAVLEGQLRKFVERNL
jgi:hypothetical protein